MLNVHWPADATPYTTIRERRLVPKLFLFSRKKLCKCSFQIITANLSKGVSNMNLTNMYVGLKPKLVIMAMVTNESYSGTRDSSPFLFTHNSLSSFKFLLNGNGLPATPYDLKVSTAENSYYRVFSKLFETLGYADKSNLINESNFLKENFFIAQVHRLNNANASTVATNFLFIFRT